MVDELQDSVSRLPREPGVYLFLGRRGRVLYVGKAKDLRARVRQYFAGQDGRAMVPFLVNEVQDVDVVVVGTEKEALILENTLIKKHRPRYNTRLVDDANFLHLAIDPTAPWPDYHLRRRLRRDGGRQFGPLTSASRARATLEFLGRHFPLRTCSDRELKQRTRPCLLHQMHRCLAPCVDLCSKDDYDQVVQQSLLFLEGRNTELLGQLKRAMFASAEAEAFEEAARLRDLIGAIEATVERQRVVDRKLGERDAWGLYREGDQGVVVLFQVRDGLLQEPMEWPCASVVEADDALLSTVINTWYVDGQSCPAEILLPVALHDGVALEEVLRERYGRKVSLRVPARGEKVRLLQLALDNARSAFQRAHSLEERASKAVDSLQEVCRLQRRPTRIECFDNSNISGTDPVASMVVFIHGQAARSEYRRYRVKTIEGSDDYGSMREILGRRLRRGQTDGVLPDLVVVDGGKGQVAAACQVRDDLGMTGPPIIGLAKPRTEHRKGKREATDKIVLPNIRDPIRLPHNSPALRLLQALRDESHRVAVQYHRKVRRKRTLTSQLDIIEGVGPVRRRALLGHFGSYARLKSATAEQIAAVPGISTALAQRIAAALGGTIDEA